MTLKEKYYGKFEVVKNIMNSGRLNETDKLYHIEMLLKGWSDAEDLEWIWRIQNNKDMFKKLIGERFESLQELEVKMEKICGKKVHCFESESEMIDDIDYMIDYEIEGDDDVYTLFYLKGRGENKYYITEV